jgi:hypothetical protein
MVESNSHCEEDPALVVEEAKSVFQPIFRLLDGESTTTFSGKKDTLV